MNKNVKICCVVLGETLEDFLKNLEEVQKVSDFVELRVDYIKNLTLNNLDIIRKNTTKENIFTCRSVEEGGKFEGSRDELLEIINRANELNFDHIDVEISKLKYINFTNKNSKIIGSYHNFKETPDFEELKNIYNEIFSYEVVDVVKMATNVVEDLDNINLVKLILGRKGDIIALGMGEKGKITRIITPLLGSYLTFASVGDNKSASGQISLDELKNMYNM